MLKYLKSLEAENFKIHSLHKLYPDERINVSAEQQLLEQHDIVVLQFPLY